MAVVEVRAPRPGDLAQLPNLPPGLFLEHASWPHTQVCCVEEVPMLAWGIIPLWEGVGMAWVAEAQPMQGHPYGARIARHIRRAWRAWSPQYRWIEALALGTRHDSRRLAELLGLREVRIKPGYGPDGETMVLYEWRGASR